MVQKLSDLDDLIGEYDRLKPLTRLKIPDIDPVVQMTTQYNALIDQQSGLDEILREIDASNDIITANERRLILCNAKLNQIMGKRCPLCGGKIVRRRSGQN
jgi:hypothetical protein